MMSKKTVLEPQTVGYLEYSVHKCPKFLEREIKRIFPSQFGDKGSEELKNLLLVITLQRSEEDLIAYGDKIEKEKERLWESVSKPTFDLFFDS